MSSQCSMRTSHKMHKEHWLLLFQRAISMPLKQRFKKSVSLITGFEKTVLGCHSKGSSFGEQALAE